MRKWIAIASLVVLGACARADLLTEVGIETKKNYNDTQAKIYAATPCDTAVGAYFRLPEQQQCGISLLCGGTCSVPVQLNEVMKALTEALDGRAER